MCEGETRWPCRLTGWPRPLTTGRKGAWLAGCAGEGGEGEGGRFFCQLHRCRRPFSASCVPKGMNPSAVGHKPSWMLRAGGATHLTPPPACFWLPGQPGVFFLRRGLRGPSLGTGGGQDCQLERGFAGLWGWPLRSCSAKRFLRRDGWELPVPRQGEVKAAAPAAWLLGLAASPPPPPAARPGQGFCSGAAPAPPPAPHLPGWPGGSPGTAEQLGRAAGTCQRCSPRPPPPPAASRRRRPRKRRRRASAALGSTG